MPKNAKNIIVDLEYSIECYNLFTNTNSLRGVAIYVINEIDAQLFTFDELDTGTIHEMIWLRFK